MVNSVKFLHAIVARLRKAGIETIVFGGWAEELMKAIPPRPHHDVDLLYFEDNFIKVDEFLANQADLEEIRSKRFSHKRAFLWNGIMVELLLVQEGNKQYITNLWGEYRLE